MSLSDIETYSEQNREEGVENDMGNANQRTPYSRSSTGDSGGVSDGDDDQSTGNSYLPSSVQRKAEASLGQSFSGVNIYQNSSRAKNLGAKAFTQGNAIYFSPGNFNPYTRKGQELIAHELVHVAQQRSETKGAVLHKSAENQADELTARVMEGANIDQQIIGVPFNTIQLKPDIHYPPDLEKLVMHYFVYISESGPRSVFKKMIADQIYRNKELSVNLTKGSSYYYKGKLITVQVELGPFIRNLLLDEYQSNTEKFEQREHLMQQYVYREWLAHTKNSHHLSYFSGDLKEEDIKKFQGDLASQLRQILEHGQVLRKEKVHIPSYNRSSYESGAYKDSDEKQMGRYTSREEALVILDEVFQYMPFEDKNDYVEVTLRRIPGSDQVAGIYLNYFYYDKASDSYWPSEDVEIVVFDPYKVYSSKNIFSVVDGQLEISFSSKMIGMDHLKNDHASKVTIKHSGNKILLNSGVSAHNQTLIKKDGQLILERPDYEHTEKFRNRNEIGGKLDGRTLIDRKFREKQLYANQRHHNAVKRLNQLENYYQSDNSYAKVQKDYNQFFLNANLGAVDALDIADQFSILFLVQSLSSEEPKSPEEAKDIFISFLDLFNFSFDGLEEANDLKSLKELLLAKKTELVTQRAEEKKRKESNPEPSTDIGNRGVPEHVRAAVEHGINEANAPYEIRNLEDLLDVFLAYLNNEKHSRENLKSSLNQTFSSLLLNKHTELSLKNQKLESIRSTIETADEKEKLKKLKEILRDQSPFVLNDPWIQELLGAKSLDAFKSTLQQKPNAEVSLFFGRILEGSLLSSVLEKEKDIASQLQGIDENRNLKEPLERMHNAIGSFLQNNNLEAENLVRINAVFYPGEEGIRKEAKIVEGIPINLYTYTRENQRHVVLFMDDGERVRTHEFDVTSNTEEILTSDLLRYVDEQKTLGQGTLYYYDQKKFDGESSYSKQISSYEFVTPVSNWERASNIASGAVFVLSLLAGPAGWARNAAYLLTTLGLTATSVVTMSIDKWRKSQYQDVNLLGKDGADLFFATGGLLFDALKVGAFAKILRKANAQNPQLVQQALKSVEKIEKAQFYFGVTDALYNVWDISEAIKKHGLGANEAYSIGHLLFFIYGAGKSLKGSNKVLNRSISSDFSLDNSFNYSRKLNDSDEFALPASKEFQVAISYFNDNQIKQLSENLKALKEQSKELYHAFLSNFGKGKGKTQLDDYMILGKMAITSAPNGIKGEIEDLLKAKKIKTNGQQPKDFVDPSKVKQTNKSIGENQTAIKSTEERIDDLYKAKMNVAKSKAKIARMELEYSKNEKAIQSTSRELSHKKALVQAKTQLIADTKELIALQEKIKRKKQIPIAKAKQEISAFEEKIVEQTKSIEGIRETVKGTYQDLKQTRADLKKAKSEKTRSGETIESYSKEIQTLEDITIPEHKAGVKINTSKWKEVDASVKTKEKDIKAVDEEIKSAKKVKERADDYLKRTKEPNFNVQDEIDRLKKEMTNILKSSGGKSKNNSEEIARISQEIAALRNNPKKYQKAVEKRSKAAKEELEGLEAKKDQLEIEKKELEAEKGKIEEALKEADQKKSKAEALHKELSLNKEAETEVFDQLSKKVEDLDELKKTQGGAIKELMTDIERKKGERSKTRGDLADKEKELEELTEDLEKTNTTIRQEQKKQKTAEAQLKIGLEEQKSMETTLTALIKKGERSDLAIQGEKKKLGDGQSYINAESSSEVELKKHLEKLKGKGAELELQKLQQLQAYETTFSLNTLSANKEIVSDVQGLLTRLLKGITTLKRHQVKRIIKGVEDQFIEVVHNEDYRKAVEETLAEIKSSKQGFKNLRNEIQKSITNSLLSEVKQQREIEEQAMELQHGEIEKLATEIRLLELKIATPEEGQNQEVLKKERSSKKAKLKKLKNEIVSIEKRIGTLKAIEVKMSGMNQTELKNFLGGEAYDGVDSEHWKTIVEKYNKLEMIVSTETQLIATYIEKLDEIAEFFETNYSSALRKDAKFLKP